MNILVGFNDLYAMPTQVMLKSLIENNNCTIDIYVLYILLSDASKYLLLPLKSKRVNIYYIQVEESDFDSVPVMDGYSKEAYIRLFAHTYLPENVERILWLDGDLIINGPINEYYDQSFDGKLYIADRDFDYWDNPVKKKSLGMPSGAVYINSGVLLLNITGIKEEIQNEEVVKYIQKYYDKIEFVDQDVFNGLLYNDFKIIDPDHIYNYPTNKILPPNKKRIYQNVHILHYLGAEKPWKKNYSNGGFLIWWKYALLADKGYKKIYKTVFFSCLMKRPITILKFYIKSICPHMFNQIKKWKNASVK